MDSSISSEKVTAIVQKFGNSLMLNCLQEHFLLHFGKKKNKTHTVSHLYQ